MQVQQAKNELKNCRSIDEFEKLHRLGEGTYGIVFLARHKQTNKYYAIKKMKLLDKDDGFPLTSLRQIKILKSLSNHPNIIQLKQVVVGVKKQLIFLVLEYCQIDLSKLIQQMFIDKLEFNQSQIKCLCLQLIKGMNYAHQNYIIHRDLKLSNLLLNKDGILKIADFGLSRQFGTQIMIMIEIPLKPQTRKVVTLWYRAPELLLKNKLYSTSIDIWSLGCIIAELLQQGQPLFKSNNQIHQFQLICQLIAYPTKENFPEFFMESFKKFRKEVEKFSIYRKNNIAIIFKNYSKNCIDLLSSMLCWNPSKRIPLSKVLYHPYFYQKPKAFFPDQLRILPRLQFYSKKNIQEKKK